MLSPSCFPDYLAFCGAQASLMTPCWNESIRLLGSHVVVCTGTRPICASLPLFKTVRRLSTLDIWHLFFSAKRFSHHPGWDEVMPVSLAVSLESSFPKSLPHRTYDFTHPGVHLRERDVGFAPFCYPFLRFRTRVLNHVFC